MLAMSVLSAFLPQESWLNIANFVIIIASVLGWIFLLTEKKTKREDYGLHLHGKFLTAFAICAYFLVVKTGMVFLSLALLSDASPARPLRRTARRTGGRRAVGAVASAAESFLLQPRHLTAEHYRTACCLRDAGGIFHLCL